MRVTHKIKSRNVYKWLTDKGYAGKLNISDKFYTRLQDTIIAGRTCRLYYVNNRGKCFALVDDGRFIYVLETREAITEFNIKYTMEHGGEVSDEILNQIAYKEYLDWDNKKPPL